MEPKKPISHLVAGLIIAGILIVSSILISVIGTGTASRPGGGWISYLILIGGLVFFINKYGNDRENYASFGELFSYGFKATAMITLVFILFIVGIALLFPEFKEKALEAAQLEMESQKKLQRGRCGKRHEPDGKIFLGIHDWCHHSWLYHYWLHRLPHRRCHHQKTPIQPT